MTGLKASSHSNFVSGKSCAFSSDVTVFCIPLLKTTQKKSLKHTRVNL